MSTAPRSRPRWTRSSTRRRTPTAVRHPAGRRCCSSPGTYNVNANVGFYTSVTGLGRNPDDVNINGDVTVDAQRLGAGNATQNFWRSAENLAINPAAAPTAGRSPRPRRSAGWTSTAASTSYPAGYGWARGGYIADSRVVGPGRSRPPSSSGTRGQQHRRLERRLEHGVLGVDGAPAQSFPNPVAYTTRSAPPRSPGEAVPVHRLGRQVPGVRAEPAHQRRRRQLGQRPRRRARRSR